METTSFSPGHAQSCVGAFPIVRKILKKREKTIHVALQSQSEATSAPLGATSASSGLRTDYIQAEGR
jgi:hypothetical protein